MALNQAKQLAAEEAIELLFVDESGFSTLPNVQRSWSPLGQPHCAEAGESRKRINVLGALNYHTRRLEYTLHTGSICQQEVEAFLQRLAEPSPPDRFTLVILDNARIHHALSEEIRDTWLNKHRFVLCFLPTYSPELNLIEILWKQAKYHWRRFAKWSASDIEPALTAMLDQVGTTFKFNFA